MSSIVLPSDEPIDVDEPIEFESVRNFNYAPVYVLTKTRYSNHLVIILVCDCVVARNLQFIQEMIYRHIYLTMYHYH